MSALARYFKAKGKYVAGYDRSVTELTKTLEKEGIEINYTDEVAEIPEVIRQNNENSLIVYTPAVPKDSKQFIHLKDYSQLVKRAELLGMVTHQKYCLAVAGTHGKTTTTAILGHLLKETGAKVTAFLGGISEDIQSNLIMQGDDVVVVEADEFDRSFFKAFSKSCCSYFYGCRSSGYLWR